MLTKKHFEKIAGEFKYLTDMVKTGETNDMTEDMIAGYFAGLEQLAENMAIGFQAENERFDKNRFMAACGF